MKLFLIPFLLAAEYMPLYSGGLTLSEEAEYESSLSHNQPENRGGESVNLFSEE